MSLKLSIRSFLLPVLILQQIVLPVGLGSGVARFALSEARADDRMHGQVDDDYDVEKYAEIARRAQETARVEHEQLDRAEALEREARQARDEAQSRLAKTRADLAAAQAAAQAERAEIEALRTRIGWLTGQIRDLEAAIARSQTEVEQAKAEAARKDARADDLEAKADAARKAGSPDAPELERQAHEARGAAKAAAQAAREAVDRLHTYQERLSTTQTDLRQARTKLEEDQADLERLVQQTIPTLQRVEPEQVRTLETAEQVLALRHRDAEQARREFEAARGRAEAAERRLAEVRANLDRAIAEARQQGTLEGSREGARDGTIDGRNDGIRDGSQNGNAEGRRDGIAEGTERARRAGAHDGREAGWSLGANTGIRDGESNGRRDGGEKGREDGLIAGYRAGLAEGDAAGYAKGSEKGHQDGGYDKGRSQGRIDGEARAVAEANQVGTPQGYAEAEREIRESSLQDVTVPGPVFREMSRWSLETTETKPAPSNESSPLRSFNAQRIMNLDSQSTASRPSYPHPAIAEAYDRAYETAYRQSRQEAHDREYREAYRAAYDATYRHEFAEWASKDYPNDYREAYDRASAVAYDEAYRREYQPAYDRTYGPAYSSSYSASLPVRRKEGYDRGYPDGFKRGRQEAFDADYSQGYGETEGPSHDAAYPAALERAREEGRKSARAYYAGHAVLDVIDLRLTDRNADGVFAAGEPLDLRAVINNYGGVSTAGNASVSVEFAPLSEGLEVSGTTAASPTLGSRTKTTVLSLASTLSLRLKAGVQSGSAQRIRVRLVQQGTLLAERVLEIRPSQTFQVVNIQFPGPISDGVWNSGLIAIRNQGNRPTAQAIHVRLNSTESALEIENREFDVPAMAGGEIREIPFRFRFPASLAFRKLPLDVSLTGGTWQAGSSRIEFDTTRRWSYNPASEGLLVVTTRDEGLALDQAARAAGLGFDFWNTLAEGALGAETVRLYRNRSVIVADARTITQPETRDSLLAGFEAGTSILDLSAVRSVPNFGRGQSLAEALSDRVSSVPLDQQVDALLVRESNPFAADSAHRWMKRVNENGAADPNAPALARAIVQSLAISRSYDEQLALAQQSGNTFEASAALRALSHSIVMEMRGVDAVGGNQFNSKSQGFEQLKVNRYVGAIVGGAQSKERASLLSIFPDLDTARKDLGGWFDRQRLQLKKILKPVSKLYRNG